MKSLLLLGGLLWGCEEAAKTQETTPKKKEYQLVQPSEMSKLMNQMYDLNEQIKAELMAGELTASYTSVFENIHKATLTDPTDRDVMFDGFAKAFVQNQQAIFEVEGLEAQKEQYNVAIETCIACHSKKCVGPIPRIKKLLLK